MAREVRGARGIINAMRMDRAIDDFISDKRTLGRINSDRTEVSYRGRLRVLQDASGDRDPREIDREDVKLTLRRWKPNTARNAHSIFVSFFDWMTEEGYRVDNPARAVSRPMKRPVSTYRMTRDEVVQVLDASLYDRRAYRLAHFGLLAGLRRAELCGLQGRHLRRPGTIWLSRDIAKGGKESWLPVLPELAPVVEECRERVADDEFVIPARRPIDPPVNTKFRLLTRRATSPKALWELTGELGRVAGLDHALRPHLLRHAFGDHVAKAAGLRVAQALMRHADVNTTAGTYTSDPGLDELREAVGSFAFRGVDLPGFGGASLREDAIGAFGPFKATTGIEPVDGVGDARIRLSERLAWVQYEIRDLAERVREQERGRYPEEVR